MRKKILALLLVLLLIMVPGCKGNGTDTNGKETTEEETTEEETTEEETTEEETTEEETTEEETTEEETTEEETTEEETTEEEMTEEETTEEETTEEETEEETHVLSEYYPFLDNVIYYYQGDGNEYASFTFSVDAFRDNRVQTRTNNGGTEFVEVVEIKDGKITQIISRPECYYRENFIPKAAEQSDVLLKEPIVKGTEWTSADGRRRYISNVDVAVQTPIGNYSAVEVTTEYAQDTVKDYYAPGVGLVKTMWESVEGYKVTSTLAEIRRNQPLVQRITFFYPDSNVEKLYYVSREISFNTNDITRIKLQQVFKELPSSRVARVLTDNVKINWLYLNKDGMLYVDFSKELVTEMNAGAGYESLILASITNTLGNYYGVQKVYITVAGEPYSSGHIEMKRGEAFIVNTDGAVPLQ